MVYFGAFVLWIVAILSFGSMAVAQRTKIPVTWLSGFITAVAVMDTLIVLSGVR